MEHLSMKWASLVGLICVCWRNYALYYRLVRNILFCRYSSKSMCLTDYQSISIELFSLWLDFIRCSTSAEDILLSFSPPSLTEIAQGKTEASLQHRGIAAGWCLQWSGQNHFAVSHLFISFNLYESSSAVLSSNVVSTDLAVMERLSGCSSLNRSGLSLVRLTQEQLHWETSVQNRYGGINPAGCWLTARRLIWPDLGIRWLLWARQASL